jgi:hypothetical protein
LYLIHNKGLSRERQNEAEKLPLWVHKGYAQAWVGNPKTCAFYFPPTDNQNGFEQVMASGPQRSLTMIRADENLRKAGISKSVFASLLNTPTSTMKSVFAGRVYVGAELESRYLELSARCRDFMSAMYPLTFVDWTKLKELLATDRTPDEVHAAIASVFGDRE